MFSSCIILLFVDPQFVIFYHYLFSSFYNKPIISSYFLHCLFSFTELSWIPNLSKSPPYSFIDIMTLWYFLCLFSFPFISFVSISQLHHVISPDYLFYSSPPSVYIILSWFQSVDVNPCYFLCLHNFFLLTPYH